MVAIWIDDRELPYQTHDIYDVHLDEHCIETLVTDAPHIVGQWIKDVRPLAYRHEIVGLDVEWRPNFERNQGDNPVAVLQLCVDDRCLVFQILQAPFIPRCLVNFLTNDEYTFVGVGIERDVERLEEWYNLSVVNLVDLRVLAAERMGRPDYKNAGLKTLARELLGKKIWKPKSVTCSPWDMERLTEAQVKYACLDAFLSYEIGRVLDASDPF